MGVGSASTLSIGGSAGYTGAGYTVVLVELLLRVGLLFKFSLEVGLLITTAEAALLELVDDDGVARFIIFELLGRTIVELLEEVLLCVELAEARLVIFELLEIALAIFAALRASVTFLTQVSSKG